jgi:hypothetical protein
MNFTLYIRVLAIKYKRFSRETLVACETNCFDMVSLCSIWTFRPGIQFVIDCQVVKERSSVFNSSLIVKLWKKDRVYYNFQNLITE